MIIKEPTIEFLRERREKECFSVINRGKLWYDRLTKEQLSELEAWYQKWLDVTKTMNTPVAPKWINDKTEKETEEILI